MHVKTLSWALFVMYSIFQSACMVAAEEAELTSEEATELGKIFSKLFKS
nr:venom peptide [Acharia stimulea]